jgi:hypothetical protein
MISHCDAGPLPGWTNFGFTSGRRTVHPQTLCDLCDLLCDLFLLPIASDFNRILPGVILKQRSATPTKALRFTLACPIAIYFGQQ